MVDGLWKKGAAQKCGKTRNAPRDLASEEASEGSKPEFRPEPPLHDNLESQQSGGFNSPGGCSSGDVPPVPCTGHLPERRVKTPKGRPPARQACRPGAPGTCDYVAKDFEYCGMPCSRVSMPVRHVCRCVEHGRNRRQSQQTDDPDDVLSGFIGTENQDSGESAAARVDFGHREERFIEAEGKQHPTSSSKLETTAERKTKDRWPDRQKWTIDEMQAKTETIEHTQTVLNSRLHALVKSKARAVKLGTSPPPEFDQLDEELQLVESAKHRSLHATGSRRRIWDTGASKGMSRIK